MLIIVTTVLITGFVVGTLMYLAARQYYKSELFTVADQARRTAWAEGFNEGWDNRGQTLMPYIDQERYERIFANPFTK